jgi:hypothetical protein
MANREKWGDGGWGDGGGWENQGKTGKDFWKWDPKDPNNVDAEIEDLDPPEPGTYSQVLSRKKLIQDYSANLQDLLDRLSIPTVGPQNDQSRPKPDFSTIFHNSIAHPILFIPVKQIKKSFDVSIKSRSHPNR